MNTLKEKLEKLESAFKLFSEAVKSELMPDLLSGKCAIQVNNEREFKLLMEHYESKGWKLSAEYMSFGFPQTANYDNSDNGWSCGEDSKMKSEKEGRTVVPFSDFAAEVGVKVPVFVMTSDDGMPLYEGDEYYRAYLGNSEKWHVQGVYNATPTSIMFKYPSGFKAFSTSQSAEEWILEQNKPKEVECKLFGGKTANISHDVIRIFDGKNTINLYASDLEDMFHAYKTISNS